jgi:DNA polymerase-3 subunit epsilon
MSFIKKIINNGNVELYKYDGEDLKEHSSSSNQDLSPTSELMHICFLDTETTGTNLQQDKIIEIALKVIEINKNTGGDIKVIDSYQSLQDPGIPIPESASEINGIYDADVKGKNIDWDKVSHLISNAQLVVAHNAKFDRPFVDSQIEASKNNKIWACSINDINWMERGFKNTKQELLCIWHGFYYESHRAMLDVDALIHLVTNNNYETNFPIIELIGNARRSQCVAYAFNAPIKNKDILKSNKYHWDPNKKVWHRTIERTQLEDERLWLEENVYDGNFTGQFIEITPADKYKE